MKLDFTKPLKDQIKSLDDISQKDIQKGLMDLLNTFQLKYLYRPKWQYDQIDKAYYGGHSEPVLHFSTDKGATWHLIPYEEYPNEEEAQKLMKNYPPITSNKEEK